MKTCRNITSKILVVTASLALACWPGAAHAQTSTILLPPGAIQINGSPTDTNVDWGLFWDGYLEAGGSAIEVYTNGFSSSNDIPGSIHVTLLFSGDAASNAPTGPSGGAANLAVGDFITPGIGYNNQVNANQTNEVDFSQYAALSFDIYVNINTSSNSAIPVSLYDWNGDTVQIGSVPIPSTNGWQHFSFPIGYNFSFSVDNPGAPPPPNGTAWGFYNWYETNPPGCEDFYIDNVQLVGAPAPPAPTLMPPVKTIPGLNAFASTEADGAYDEQQVMLLANTGLSWVGRASAAQPVSYSFTIDGFPTNSPWNAEAYLLLIPNPNAEETAADWDEASGVTISVDSTGNGGGAMNFTYKVNDPDDDSMYWSIPPWTNAPGSCDGATNCFETGDLATVYSAKILGTWTVTFTSDTDGTLTGPDGTTTNFIFPSYNVSYFADTNSFNVYLGFEANNTNAINEAVVYSSFSVTNVPSACSDNFLADTTLNSNLWTSEYSIGPAGVLIVTSNSPWWESWTLPAYEFSLADSASLGPNTVWKSVSTYVPIPMYGLSQQLISTNDLTGTNAEFFALIKRAFTQLLVVLPGETYAPGTATGKTGTPTSVSLGNNEGEEDVTVYAVDPKFFPVSGVTDSISLTSTDPNETGELPPAQAMVNGQVTFSLANAPDTFFFFTQGSWTITATDTTNPSITPGTSSSVTVGP